MWGYIKDFATFGTADQRETLDYKLVLDSMSAETGIVTLAGDDLPASLAGSWFIINSEPFFISQLSPKRGKTDIKLLPVIGLFDRDLLYEDISASTIGGYIASIIGSEWINQDDAVYATPYMTVTNTDTTAFVQPAVDDNGVFNFLAYIEWARETYNISVRAEVSKNALNLTISKDTASVHPLVVNDGHTQLSKSSFSSSVVAKLTVLQPEDSGEVDDEGQPIMNMISTVWYLAADGTASTTVPLNRAVGSWQTITIGEDDDPQEKVVEEFAKNSTSHKVELYSDTQMKVGDTIKVRIGGEVFEGVINAISHKKGDFRKLYRIGDLPTTLTEELAALKSGEKVIIRNSGGGGDLPAWTPGSY